MTSHSLNGNPEIGLEKHLNPKRKDDAPQPSNKRAKGSTETTDKSAKALLTAFLAAIQK